MTRLSPAPSSGDGILPCMSLLRVSWEANRGNVSTKGDWGAQSQNCNVIIADMVTDHVLWDGCDFRNGSSCCFRGRKIMFPKVNSENVQGSEVAIFNNTVGSGEDVLSGDQSASTKSSILDVHQPNHPWILVLASF